MSVEKTQQLVQQYYQYFNEKNWKGMLDLLSEDVVHYINQGGLESGKDAFFQFLLEMDAHYDEHLSEIVVMVTPDGTRAAAELVCTGRYIKQQSGMPPAYEQSYKVAVGAFFEIKNSKITRVTTYYNFPEWVQQVSR